jgi:hypothetical protein
MTKARPALLVGYTYPLNTWAKVSEAQWILCDGPSKGVYPENSSCN